MAFNTRYYASFYDTLKSKIDIYIKQKDFAGSPELLLLDVNPLIISYPTKDFDDQLFGGGCKINVINNSDDYFKYDNLFTAPERTNYIEIIKTSNLVDGSIFLFQGYVLPEMYTTTLEKNKRVTIPGVDQLSALDRYKPSMLVDTTTFRAAEYYNAFDLISNILQDADITNDIHIHNDLETINNARDGSSSVFNSFFLSSDNFADSNDIEDSKTCLEKILKPFYSRCFYNNGKWQIERLADIQKYTKEYAVYTDASSGYKYQLDVSNNRRSLDQQHLIAKSVNLSFNPGAQKLVTKLNYKQAPSLIENYYYDVEFRDPSNCTKSKKPTPNFRRWMMSDASKALSGTDGSLGFQVYTDPNIKSGLMYYPSNAWLLNPDKWTYFANQYATSSFQFTPAVDDQDTVVDIKYSYSVTPDIGVNGKSVNGNFALRVVDGSTGTDWWVAKRKPNDSSIYWSSTPYLFNASILYEDLRENNYKLEVSQQVNLSHVFFKKINKYVKLPWGETYTTYNQSGPREQKTIWYRTNTTVAPQPSQTVCEVFLDIYPITRQSNYWTGYLPFNTMFGDVDVDIKKDIPYDTLEASIGTFTGIVEKTLDVFDVSTALFVNGLFNTDTSYNLSSINKWRTWRSAEPSDNYSNIQYKYMEDLTQMYAKSRYLLDLDLRSNDVSLFTLGDIYTHSKLIKDGSLLEFICNGYDYNVKENAYRMSLIEFQGDDSWRLDAPYVAPAADPQFIVTPTDISFDGNGTPNISYINVSTNKLNWTDEVSTNCNTWVTTYAGTTGKQREYIYAGVNEGNARDGSVLIIPESGWGFTPVWINVHQDASIAPVGSSLAVDPNVKHINGEAGSFDINVYSNTSWTLYDISNPGASSDTYSGTGNTMITISYPSYYVDVLEWSVSFKTDDDVAYADTMVFQNENP